MNVMRVKEFANVELLGDRKITSFIIGEKIYFKAKDVAIVATSEKAIRDHAIRKYRVTFGKIQKVNETFTLHPHTVLIQEFGLYEIMMKSHQEKAIMFQEWIYEEVLPSIRKTGQ
jgi:prophage antirepressor-like protein